METIPSVKVSKQYALQMREFLQRNDVLDLRYRLQHHHEDGTVILPVLPSALPEFDVSTFDNVSRDCICEIVQVEAPLLKKGNAKSCKAALIEAIRNQLLSVGESWSEDLKRDLPQSWQRHGDLILLGGDSFTLPVWRKIGSALWSTVARALGVKRLAQIQQISNNGFRTPLVTMLLGESSQVIHIDNKIRYEFDITKCMFSFGNITEKLRIASFNCKGETVVDLYAGIGYFTLPYLVHAGAAHVHACEWNPDAVEALRRNLDLNKVSDRCTIHQGDNRELPLVDLADRVNLGLIPSSEQGWPVACRLLRRQTGGVLHIHSNVTTPLHRTDVTITTPPIAFNHSLIKDMDVPDEAKEVTLSLAPPDDIQRGTGSDRQAWSSWAEDTARHIAGLLADMTGGSWRTHIQHIERVKSYAPHVHHIVLDLECRPLGRTC